MTDDPKLTDEERAASPYADIREPRDYPPLVETVARHICVSRGGKPDEPVHTSDASGASSLWKLAWKAYAQLAEEIIALVQAG